MSFDIKNIQAFEMVTKNLTKYDPPLNKFNNRIFEILNYPILLMFAKKDNRIRLLQELFINSDQSKQVDGLESFKNSTAIYFSDKILTREVENVIFPDKVISDK